MKPTKPKEIEQLSENSEKINKQVNSELQYVKKKSDYVTPSQEAGIDLAMTTAYTWNKNIVDFTRVVQTLVQTNLGEHWEVCTYYENNSQVSFRYTSPS